MLLLILDTATFSECFNVPHWALIFVCKLLFLNECYCFSPSCQDWQEWMNLVLPCNTALKGKVTVCVCVCVFHCMHAFFELSIVCITFSVSSFCTHMVTVCVFLSISLYVTCLFVYSLYLCLASFHLFICNVYIFLTIHLCDSFLCYCVPDSLPLPLPLSPTPCSQFAALPAVWCCPSFLNSTC